MNNKALFLGSIFKNGWTGGCCDNDFLRIAVQDSDTVTWEGDGTTANPLIATAIGGGVDPEDLISADGGNQIVLGSDDLLFVPASTNIFPEIFVGILNGLTPSDYIRNNSGILTSGVNYTSTTSPIVVTFTPAETIRGGFIAYDGGGSSTITWPDANDLYLYIGEDVTAKSFDFIAVNSDQTNPITFVLGADMTAFSAITGGDNLVVDPQTTAYFKFTGYVNGSTMSFQVSRIS